MRFVKGFGHFIDFLVLNVVRGIEKIINLFSHVGEAKKKWNFGTVY